MGLNNAPCPLMRSKGTSTISTPKSVILALQTVKKGSASAKTSFVLGFCNVYQGVNVPSGCFNLEKLIYGFTKIDSPSTQAKLPRAL